MKFVKGVLLALLFSLLVGLVIGTALRMRLERPTHYIGELLNADGQLQELCRTTTRAETRAINSVHRHPHTREC